MTRLCLLVVLLANLAGATVYIVDQAAPNAADTNPGTAAAPLRTVGVTAALVQPGDTVVIRPGVYRERIPLRTSGTTNAPIVYRAETPRTVTICGADVIEGWRRVPGDEPIYKAPWPHQFRINTRADGTAVEHHPGNAPVWGRAEQVIVDGRQLVPAGTLAALREAWVKRPPGPLQPGRRPVPDFDNPATWPGMFAVDTIDAKELYLWLADGSDPGAHTVEAATRSDLFGFSPWGNRDGLSHVEVRGLDFRYGATYPQRAAVWLQGRDNLVEDCLISDMAGGGIEVGGTLRRCLIQNCGHTGGAASGEGFVNEDSVWRNNCWKPISRGWDAGGVKMARAKSGLFRRCWFYRNGGPGLWFDIHVRHVLVTECVFWENEGSGLFIEISRDIDAVRNLAVRNAVGAVPTVEGPDWAAAGIMVAESYDCLIAYNTCVGNKDGITLREQGPRPLDTEEYGIIPYHNRGHVIVGNVLADNRGYQLGLWYDNAFFGRHPADQQRYPDDASWQARLRELAGKLYDPRAVGLTIDRNLYAAGVGQRRCLYGVPWRPGHRIYDDLGELAEATGFERRGLVAEAGFRGPDDFGFAPDAVAAREELGWRLAPPLALPRVLSGE